MMTQKGAKYHNNKVTQWSLLFRKRDEGSMAEQIPLLRRIENERREPLSSNS